MTENAGFVDGRRNASKRIGFKHISVDGAFKIVDFFPQTGQQGFRRGAISEECHVGMAL